jgi:uroporphyrinogen decarboxylase
MQAKQRVRIAMQNGAADCVPFIPQICVPHAVRMLGLEFEETLLQVIRDPLLMNRLTFDCVKGYGVDGLRAWLPPEPLEVERVKGVWHGVDPKTGKIIGPVDFQGGGGVVAPEIPVIETLADIERIPVPTAAEIIAGPRLDGIRDILREAGDDYFVISAPCIHTVEYLTFQRGKLQAMMDLIDRPEFCHYAQEKALAIALEEAKALTHIGIDAFMLADTYGGLISPALFKEFCMPYWRRFIEAQPDDGPLIYLHICGKSSPLFELMADTGVDCIEPLDAIAGVSVADAKRRVGKRVALMGGMNTVTLAHGTLDEVVADCRRCLNDGGPGGGYLLASGDMLPTETTPEKVRVMLDMARAYRY